MLVQLNNIKTWNRLSSSPCELYAFYLGNWGKGLISLAAVFVLSRNAYKTMTGSCTYCSISNFCIETFRLPPSHICISTVSNLSWV